LAQGLSHPVSASGAVSIGFIFCDNGNDVDNGFYVSINLGGFGWLEEHEYDSLRQMQGSMNLESCPDPRAYERANYMLMLQGWRAGD
jgi:hypothetical protein